MSNQLKSKSTGDHSQTVDLIAIAMGVSFALMWSSAFTSAKIALADAPPFLLLAIRFAISGLIAIAIAWMAGQRLPSGRRVWLAIGILGFCQNSLYLGLNFLAMTEVPAGLAAIIASSLPLLVALFSWLFLHERLPGLALFGLVIGFAGVIFIMADRLSLGASPFGLACCVIGVIALASATMIVRGTDFGPGLMMVVGLQMLVGSLTLAPVALVFESAASITYTWSLGLAFTYTTIVPGLIATLVWFRLVRRIGATQASAYHFFNPAFGVAVASLILGEQFGWRDLAGVAVVTISIAMVQWRGCKV